VVHHAGKASWRNNEPGKQKLTSKGIFRQCDAFRKTRSETAGLRNKPILVKTEAGKSGTLAGKVEFEGAGRGDLMGPCFRQGRVNAAAVDEEHADGVESGTALHAWRRPPPGT
jgi:hypothetical protein